MSKYIIIREDANSNQEKETVFNVFICLLVTILAVGGLLHLWSYFEERKDSRHEAPLDLNHIREVTLYDDVDESHARNSDCRFWNCLNLYKCGHDRLSVYVYPLQDYSDAKSGKTATTLSREYYKILEAVVHSPYYTSNPNEACLFLPSLDLLNYYLVQPQLVNRALALLDYWNDGENHILINIVPNNFPHMNNSFDINSDRAIIFGGGFDTWTYRPGFDVAFPVWSPTLQQVESSILQNRFPRKYLLLVAQLNILPEQILLLKSLAQDNPKQIFIVQSCSKIFRQKSNERCGIPEQSQHRFEYPKLLSEAVFCILGRSLHLGQADLLEMLAYNCIPVIAMDNYILPFEDVIDWSLASISVRESELHSIVQKLKNISTVRIQELQQQGKWLFNRYFHDLSRITITALEILETRIFPHRARCLRQWNMIESSYGNVVNPLFLPMIAPKSQGFTAVILTYDRVDSLFTLIQKISLVPSLQSILVIWNNQHKSPPHLSTYPTIMKPLKVIQTQANKLSNRFYPYAEIETEAILTIDDDIVMLTADELDFGFEVWREFPDRIVGFPSRVHVWSNETMGWHYESEWTNQISMVLTGAAFHHKFWSHMYTYAMPGDIKDWVDEHMNCEDIAMNFLVANITNKPPIKVTPRKKFKCPECINTEMLSADLNHMRERSACIERFARIYGYMPLRSVEFRVDPVLFKDNFPEKLKRFNDIGSL